MARTKTQLEDYLVYGVDEKNRKIFFGSSLTHTEDEWNVGAFNQTSTQYAIRMLHRMMADHPRVPIEIHMDSYGGDPYAMLALYDLIQSSTCQVKFYGSGAIFSAATWIMAGCDERHLYPNTTIMVHDGWTWYDGKSTDFRIYNDEEVRLQNKLEEIYSDNSKMSIDFWRAVCQRDLYLTAEEAITLGLADRLIKPKKRGNYRKIRQYHLSQKVNKRKMEKLVSDLYKRVKLPVNTDTVTINIPEPEPVDEKLFIEELQKETIDAKSPKQED